MKIDNGLLRELITVFSIEDSEKSTQNLYKIGRSAWNIYNICVDLFVT